jgi:hypothetical protein
MNPNGLITALARAKKKLDAGPRFLGSLLLVLAPRASSERRPAIVPSTCGQTYERLLTVDGATDMIFVFVLSCVSG